MIQKNEYIDCQKLIHQEKRKLINQLFVLKDKNVKIYCLATKTYIIGKATDDSYKNIDLSNNNKTMMVSFLKNDRLYEAYFNILKMRWEIE